MTALDYIRHAVDALVHEYGTRDPYELASSQGIKGMIITLFEQRIIVLNTILPEHLQRVILAHGLGHNALSVTEAGYFFLSEYTLMESKVEYEANRFAVELLAGDADPEEGETLEQFAARMGISEGNDTAHKVTYPMPKTLACHYTRREIICPMTRLPMTTWSIVNSQPEIGRKHRNERAFY